MKNRINFSFTDRRDPIKASVGDPDLPEMTLISTTSSANIRNTSSTSMIVRQYDFIAATGDLAITRSLLPLEFAMFTAMTDWPRVLAALTWNDLHYCKRMNVTGVASGISDAEKNRGIRGWSAIWGIEVEMHFRTLDLIDYSTIVGTT